MQRKSKNKSSFLGEVPRKLLHRDPLSNFDIQVALSIVHQIDGGFVTKKTLTDLKKLGMTPENNLFLKGCKVIVRQPKTDAMMIGGFYSPGKAPVVESKIVSCMECKSMLFVSLHQIKVTDYFCVFCAADRILDEYWQEKDKIVKVKK